MSTRSTATPTPPARLLTTAIAATCLMSLAGCGMLESITGGDKVDYRSGARKTQPLDVPPDLTQLARDGRYAPQSGAAVSANAMQQAAGGTAAVNPAAAVGAATVAPNRLGEMRIERYGNERWLITPMTPEQLWPQLRNFWTERGVTLVVDNPEAGVMETEWAENRAKLPDDVIRNTLGKFLNSLYSTGERDKFRVRVERGTAGTEVTIAHRGLEEVLIGTQKESTMWTARPSDASLEGEMLTRLMVKLGLPEAQARTQVASTAPAAPGAAPAATAAGTPARARLLADGSAAMEVDDGFDRAWRRVGLALDRGGFTVEDRDRAGGLFFVRYVDPKAAAAGEPSFFSKLFGGDDAASREPVRYRIQLKRTGNKTQAQVLDSRGAPDNSENARKIVSLLVEELR